MKIQHPQHVLQGISIPHFDPGFIYPLGKVFHVVA